MSLQNGVRADALMQIRLDLKDFANERKLKLSYMPFFIKAASLALTEFPSLNALIDEKLENVVYKASHNICVAMDTPGGLVVPNIKHCEQSKDVISETGDAKEEATYTSKQNVTTVDNSTITRALLTENREDIAIPAAGSIFDIASELQRLQEDGMRERISREDLTDGTFTISNIGTIGGTYASPIIFPPQLAIGALGKIEKLPRYDSNNSLVPMHIFKVSWAADHRVIDGATIARFSNRWKFYVEHPSAMLAQLKLTTITEQN
ncbi:2-oxo acid dehydrogenase acyltransferase [Dictyocaulus viviparus]|uniref:2-oxo acid dehydrogenase acyltransferase n=1 Tax=Dictyocaulus viviparus TaxID=29172 RepID=A0A0D8X9D9_DICVI|nr:2-oxo acid dehydrogenase acyltransferase [Dictyocaulus viviparus]